MAFDSEEVEGEGLSATQVCNFIRWRNKFENVVMRSNTVDEMKVTGEIEVPK
jgi:hypothetical protein